MSVDGLRFYILLLQDSKRTKIQTYFITIPWNMKHTAAVAI